MVVSAPGKLMVSGEYAVLQGAPAVVAAVDRRAFAQIRHPGAAKAAAEACAAYVQAERALGSLGHEPTVDVSRLRTEDAKLKLGLGSSAAAAAAAAGLAFAEHGRDVASVASRAEIFDAAFRGHQEISPQGSGADVAASVHGGFLRFQKRSDAVEAEAISWPAQLRARVVWTHQEARTGDFIEQVRALAQAQPERHRTLMDGLGREAERFAASVIARDVRSVLASTMAYGRAMGELGDAAGIPIVTDTLRRVAELALGAGGAAKPSGAGGGDVAVALFPDEHAEQRFVDLCRQHNFTLLLINLGAPGVRSEEALHGGEAA
jgi:phosphomevalonate kinase